MIRRVSQIVCALGLVLAVRSSASDDLVDYRDTNASYYLGNLIHKGIKVGNHTIATCDSDVFDQSVTCKWLGSERARCFKWSSQVVPSEIVEMRPAGSAEGKLGVCTCHPVSYLDLKKCRPRRANCRAATMWPFDVS